MPATGDIVELDARAVRASAEVVSRVSAADLARPTPCGDWTLADLLAHMTVQPTTSRPPRPDTARTSSAGR